MTDQFFHPDLVRASFVIGIVFAAVSYELRHLTTGGLVVPGYVSVAFFLPYSVAVILLVALAAYALIYRILDRVLILSASATFAITVITSASLHVALDTTLIAFGFVEPSSPLLRSIGYVIPGLIAHDFARHGVVSTTVTIAVTSGLVLATIAAVAALFPEIGRFYSSPQHDTLLVRLSLVPTLVLCSLIAWLGVNRLIGLRCGGFLGGGYLALLLPQPQEILWLAAIIAATVAIVRWGLQPRAILFGRRLFAAHLLVAGCLSWSALKFRELVLVDDTIAVVTPSLAVIGVLLAGLFSFDLDRGGARRLMLGSGLSVWFTASSICLIAEILDYRRLDVAVPLLISAGLAFLVIFLDWSALRRVPPTAASTENTHA